MPERTVPRTLSIPRRLRASSRLRGRGVTVAFLDSGFFAHPDLTRPRNRILRYVDVTGSRRRLDEPDESSGHGLMTSVVACGNGWLSRGLFRGLASEAEVVLVKCGTSRRITPEHLRRGLDWVRRHRRRYRIRIVNVSCGGDAEGPYLHDALSQAAEEASRAGLFVCAAAGRAGRSSAVLPPASAPSVLAVGGVDDRGLRPALFLAATGPTVDGLLKPEILAPAVSIPVPVLPGALPSGPYQTVEGTSFACPIVASLAAQMLEADPRLGPHELRRIIVGTARRLPDVPLEAQGWGAVDARAAVRLARRARPKADRGPTPMR